MEEQEELRRMDSEQLSLLSVFLLSNRTWEAEEERKLDELCSEWKIVRGRVWGVELAVYCFVHGVPLLEE